MPTVATIDSGATHNFVSAGFVDYAKLRWRWAEPMCVTLANGASVVSSKLAKIVVKFAANAQCEMEAQVVPELHATLVLGMPWLT